MDVQEYCSEFSNVLAKTYARANDLPSETMAYVMQTRIYSVDTQAAGAIAGFQLSLEIELAVALYIQIQTISFERAHGFFKRIGSKDILNKVGEHRRMYDYSQPVFSPYNRTEIQTKFWELAASNLMRD